MIPFPLEKLSIRGTPFALFMSGRSEEKAPAVRSSPPVSPAGEMPGGADSRPPESGRRPAGLNDRWTVPGVCLFLAAMTWLVFGQTVHHEFVNYDDAAYVCENPVVQKGLTWEGFRWAFTHNVNVNWTPLTVISHMLDCQFYGLQAGGHHFTSVLLHMASVIVLFLVLKKMTAALWRSAFVAAVFAIHPLHVESVAWIAERRDVLSGLFFMLTIGAYVQYAQRRSKVESRESRTQAVPTLDPRRSTLDYCLVLLFFALGLLSKPMVVTLPFVLFLLDYWPLKRFTQPGGRLVPWRLIAEKVPLLALSGAACVATLFAQTEAIQPFEQMSLPLRVGNALISYVTYLGQMIYPAGLAVYYPYPETGLPLWKIVAAFVLLLVISAGTVATRRKQPWFLFGWLWYLGMLVPVIGVLQVGSQAQADRYTYLPQIGLYIALAWAAKDLTVSWRHRRQVLGFAATIVLAALMVGASLQTSYWRNSESLWTHTLACTSGNYVAHNNLGVMLGKKGNLNEAIRQFQEALRLKPDYAEAHNNLGIALNYEGQFDEAIAQYQEALRLKPHDTKALYNLGIALSNEGRLDEAAARDQEVLKLTPSYVEAHNNLGVVLIKKGQLDEAINQFREAL